MSPCLQPDLCLYPPDKRFHTSEVGFTYSTSKGPGVPWPEWMTPPVFILPITPVSESILDRSLRTHEPPLLYRPQRHKLCFILSFPWMPWFLPAHLIPGSWSPLDLSLISIAAQLSWSISSIFHHLWCSCENTALVSPSLFYLQAGYSCKLLRQPLENGLF